jgi:hypothetical protein
MLERCFLCSPCRDVMSSQLNSVKITKIIYVNTNFEIKAPRPLSQATVSNHSNAFTFTLTLTGRTSGRSLGTFSQLMLFLPPHNKVSLTSLQDFLTFTISSTLLLFLFLHLSLSQWNGVCWWVGELNDCCDSLLMRCCC